MSDTPKRGRRKFRPGAAAYRAAMAELVGKVLASPEDVDVRASLRVLAVAASADNKLENVEALEERLLGLEKQFAEISRGSLARPDTEVESLPILQ